MSLLSHSLQVRRAAKALIVRDGRLVMTEGRSGMLNLPGGGIDEGESSEQAVVRELGEELRLIPKHIGNRALLGNVSGIVGHQNQYVASWDAWLVDEVKGVMLPGDDVVTLHHLTPKQIIVDRRVSPLARHTMQNFLRLVVHK